jgi:hypothetical protein
VSIKLIFQSKTRLISHAQTPIRYNTYRQIILFTFLTAHPFLLGTLKSKIQMQEALGQYPLLRHVFVYTPEMPCELLFAKCGISYSSVRKMPLLFKELRNVWCLFIYNELYHSVSVTIYKFSPNRVPSRLVQRFRVTYPSRSVRVYCTKYF